MPVCTSCGTAEAGRDAVCKSCRTAANRADQTTKTDVLRSTPFPSNSANEGRFLPGTVLGQRYRIVSLLGEGGMGEVYRASDLLLGQTVALKLLPPAFTSDEAALNRFRNEVRTARMISHPNVCRVFDIGEAEGLTYLSMEYVDGEDLASLLRRIGRLPEDKALEIMRRVCAGVAAAHDKGMIHRDLKPANIMLDNLGQVRITDFGLAGIVGQLQDIGSGTPAYMAPEQLAGKEVSARSDIYALGLVLRELLTGKRSVTAAGLDPVVERAIQRCLHNDPAMRPASALEFSASLPGGDPLAAALAAGETPTPEMVANAGKLTGMRVPFALACLAAAILGIVGLSLLQQRIEVIDQIPLDLTPDTLAAKSREIAKSMGYTARPADSFFRWQKASDYLSYAEKQSNSPLRWSWLRGNKPPPVTFWYRESPAYLVPFGGLNVSPVNPPPNVPGMVEVILDSEGHLRGFEARPSGAGVETGTVDWNPVFAAAGLDPAAFKVTTPRRTPDGPYDLRAAWTGAYPGDPDDILRIEAAAFEGKLVSFRIAGPWTDSRERFAPAVDWSFLTLFLTVLMPLGALFMAWRNYRRGRGDRSGAIRLTCFTFCITLLSNLFQANHVSAAAEGYILWNSVVFAGYWAIVYAVLYIALEPWVRRRAPRMLITWNRLLDGRFGDPQLGSAVLIGVAMAAAMAFVDRLPAVVNPFIGPSASMLATGTDEEIAHWLNVVFTSQLYGLGGVFIFSVYWIAVRSYWLAAVLSEVTFFLLFLPDPSKWLTVVGLMTLLQVSFVLFSMLRFGLLTAMVMLLAEGLMDSAVLTTNLSAWTARVASIPVLTVIALAVYGFRGTLAGRPVWRDELQE